MQSTPHKSTLEESYFSETLKWTVTLGGLMLSAYLIAKTGYAWITIFLVLLSLILFSTKYILQIDAGEKLITDSFQVLWIKSKTRKFVYHELKCIRLDRQRHVYTANSRARTAQTDFNEYIGTLEYDGSSIELLRKVSYEPFAEEMKRIASELQIPIHRTF
jgi:hypothetical protein